MGGLRIDSPDGAEQFSCGGAARQNVIGAHFSSRPALGKIIHQRQAANPRVPIFDSFTKIRRKISDALIAR